MLLFKEEIDSRVSVEACLVVYGGMHLVCVHIWGCVQSMCTCMKLYGGVLCTCMGPCVGYVCMHETVWVMYAYLGLYMEYICGIYVHIWGGVPVWDCVESMCVNVWVCGGYAFMYACMKLWGMYACIGLCVGYMCMHGSCMRNMNMHTWECGGMRLHVGYMCMHGAV